MIAQHSYWLTKCRAFKYWVQLYLFQHRSAAVPVLASSALSDRIVVGCTTARGYLQQFLAYYGQLELGRKVIAAPYPVKPVFLDCAVDSERPPQIVAIGRWDDPQKDARLLADALACLVRRQPEIRSIVIGRGGENVFARLCREHPRIDYRGRQPPAEVARALAGSRVLVSTSRWEGAPNVVNEALCCGCSLVGPEHVPCFVSFCGEGPYGTTYRQRSARAVVDAVETELQHWSAGRRDPRAIAEHWRPRFDPVNVCRELLSSLATK
jgi:glycosyltransferase involved in cell wall biosynthesis